MPTFTRHLIAAVLFAFAGGTSAGADAVVIVAEDGGFDTPTVRTVRSLLSTALRARGIPVTEDARFAEPRPLDAETRVALAESGADRLFVLRLGRLGKKVLMSLEELVPDTLAPVRTASLTAERIDESDTVIPRLVRSVVEREPVEKGARIATVTDHESEPFKKKPGEGLFIIGVGLAPLGGSIGWSMKPATGGSAFSSGSGQRRVVLRRRGGVDSTLGCTSAPASSLSSSRAPVREGRGIRRSGVAVRAGGSLGRWAPGALGMTTPHSSSQ